MLIFVMGLLLAVMLLGLATAHISKLKQQRRQLSDSSAFDCVKVGLCCPRAWYARRSRGSACFSQAFAEFSSCDHIPTQPLRVSSDAGDADWKLPSHG